MKDKRDYAYVTFIIRNDSYLPGALIFAYAIRKQNTIADLICIVSSNISVSAINALKCLYDDVIVVDEVYVHHERRQERQDRPFLFSRFNALRLGVDGDLGKSYKKIIIADCDLLPLEQFDSLFFLNAPAGIINEKKEYCMDYNDKGEYIIPESFYDTGEWKWHDVYKKICSHGELIPKKITDRVKKDFSNMGINAVIYLFEPSMSLYNDIMEDLLEAETQELISKYNWPEMQYITQKLSGTWHNIDLRFASFNGYPDISYLYGTHFAGLKPWNFKNKSLKNFGRFEDYKIWYAIYKNMFEEIEGLSENRKLVKLFDHIVEFTLNNKYVFQNKYYENVKKFF